MIRLQVMAQRCDLTRVSFISLGPSQNYFHFPHLGINTDYHNVAHGNLDRTTAAEYYQRIATHHMEQLAVLLRLLKESSGLGALIDDAAVIGTSEFGDGGVHGVSNVPFIVAGKVGRGAAGLATGRHIVARDRCINDVWQSAFTALGVLGPGQKYGDPALDTRPLEGLWAA
jgi:hypothetical protein